MDQENQNLPNPEPATEPTFTKKVIETPILDAELRNQINEFHEPGFKGFYNANKFYFFAIFLGLIVIAVLAYFAFRKEAVVQPKEANISIVTDVPETIASGGEAVYKVTVQNNDSKKLVNVELELAYPEGITYESSVPNSENLSGSIFKVPDLIPGQNAALFIKTKVNGNVNDEKTLGIKLHYKLSSFNSEFIKESSAKVRLVASDVIINLEGPTNSNNAQLVLYNLTYSNNSNRDIANARIKLIYPDGFSFAQSQPVPDLSNDTWTVLNLPKNASSTITIQGTFTNSRPGESKTLTAQFLILGEGGNFFVQNTDTAITAISSLPLLITQELRDNQTGIVNPGETLNYVISYQNNGTTAASGVNIQLDLNSKVLDLGSIRAEGGQVSNNSISWNASGVSKLATLSPNQKGELYFSVKVNSPASKDSIKNLMVESQVSIRSNEYTTPFPGNALNLKVSSPASLSSTLNFVSGQLPPQVGQNTVYQVNISLTNSSNDYAGGVLTAFIPLPPGAFNMESVNAREKQSVQFDTSTGKLTWNFAGLPANTGRFSQAKTLSFNLTLNPALAQKGQSVVLVKDITANMTDVFTQAVVKLNTKNISTFDIQGQGGFGSGTVQ